MKRIFSFLMALALLLTFAAPSQVSAATPQVKVTIDGQLQSYEQPPVIIGGRTMVPMRAIFEALGAKVTWDNATRTVTATKGHTEVKLTIDSDIIHKDGTTMKMDAKALIVNSRTMVPVRFVANAMGALVEWDPKTYTVIIASAELSSIIVIQKNDMELLKDSLKWFAYDWEKPLGPQGLSLLHYAVMYNNEGALALMLEKGADPDFASTDPDIGTPLFYLMGKEGADLPNLTQALLDAGANAEFTAEGTGFTPLMAAVMMNKIESVKLLVAAGVDLNARDIENDATALAYANALGHAEIADLLVQAGAVE